MSERQTNEKKVYQKVDPFTGKAVASVFAKADKVKIDFNDYEELGVELDKETGNTLVVVTGHRDLQKEIQEFKDDCGFEGMRKLIAQGRATPKDFYDDGLHGQDVADLPDNVNDAFRAAMDSNNQSEKMLKDLGVNVGDLKTQEAIEKAITEAVNRKFAALNKEALNKEVKEDAKAE